MKLHIDGNLLYCNGLTFCRVEAGNGRANIPLGVSEVDVRTATEHGTIPMAFADGHGWIGGLLGCDIILGRVMGHYGLLPCISTQRRLVGLCEAAAESGERVTLEAAKQ